MLIRVGYRMEIEVERPTAMYALMNVHPEHSSDIRWSSQFQLSPASSWYNYRDRFGNLGARFRADPGTLTLACDAVVEDDGLPDPEYFDAAEIPPDRLPDNVLDYLLGSRYCETDKLSGLAWKLFGNVKPGWSRVQAICDYVNDRITFSYGFARSTRTAAEAHEERVGVCRDFAHLAVTFCRAMNIPARYVNGYMGDIGVDPDPSPMDFNAWFEVFLGGRWHTFDARHNQRRIGRIVVARGRDATDVPLLHTFGPHKLNRFEVWTEEVSSEGQIATLPVRNITPRASRFGPPGRSPHDLGQTANVMRLL